MSVKRFTLEEFGLNFIVNDNGRNLTAKQTVDRLNELNDENIELHIQNDFLKDENKHMRYVLNENKQLKQRNENQYNQLNQLWKLIEAKDWETLTAMDNQMKEDEERLQREWKCYE